MLGLGLGEAIKFKFIDATFLLLLLLGLMRIVPSSGTPFPGLYLLSSDLFL